MTHLAPRVRSFIYPRYCPLPAFAFPFPFLSPPPPPLPPPSVTFNYLGVPFLEPGFGTVEREPGAQVHGVCHLMTQQEFAHLQRTEGGGGVLEDGYVATQVTVQLYDGRRVMALVLEGKGRVLSTTEAVLPSARYLGLLRTGAKEYVRPLRASTSGLIDIVPWGV
jgi:hypothetical protein